MTSPRFDEDYTKERKRQLEYYLHSLLSNRTLMSQSKVLRQFLGLVDDSTPQSILKELWKRRRDEHYERLELEASAAAKENIQEETLWIEKTPHSISDESDSLPANLSAFADSPLAHLTGSVSSMAMYLENKIGYPHLKKVLNSLKDEEEENEDKETLQEQPKTLSGHLEDRFSDDEDDDNDSLDSEDMLWLGTGDGSLSRQDSISQPDGLRSPDKYRDRISDNMKRRSEYRESILLQYSGLHDDPDQQDGMPSSPELTLENSLDEISLTQIKPQESRTLIRRTWEYMMSILQSLSATRSSNVTQSIEIVPIIILAVVIYYVSRTEITKEVVK